MLTWTTVEECRAVSRNGTYRVFPNWDRRGKPFVAVLSYFDTDGRLFNHVVGQFDTVAAAKSACEIDSKS